MDTKEFVSRRLALATKLSNHSVTVLFSGLAPKASADEDYYFEVNRNFFYLTGIDQAHSMLLIVKDQSGVHETLFVDRFDELKEKWTGRRVRAEEATVISGINDVRYTDQFEDDLAAAITTSQPVDLYCDLEKDLKIGFDLTTTKYALKLKEKYSLDLLDIYPLLTSLRMVKSPAEVAALKQAIAITDVGLKAVQKQIASGKYEYQMVALFEYTIRDYANAHVSFSTITASGKNGVILHYPKPNDKIADGSLVLFDLGAAYEYYCADISRTYPADGKFDEIQEKIYSAVLDCNKNVIKMVRPGLTLADLQAYVIDFYKQRLIKDGLIDRPEEVADVYFHNVSHHLGLDTHDVSDRSLPLVPGNVITVEPGLYFKKFGVGVRIEDDVLVTDNGSECLSKAIIKEVSDVEKAISQR